MLKKHKNKLFALTGIIILFLGYWYIVVSKKDTDTSDKSLSVNVNPAQNAYDKEFVSNLQTIRYIDLNVSILSSLAYKALTFPEKPFEVDYNIPVGRRNPFLPIGVDARSNDTAQTQTQGVTVNATTSVKSPSPQPKR